MNLQWQPFVAKCSMCWAVVDGNKVVLGRQHPLATNEHYCLECARALRIKEYDAYGNLVRSHYANSTETEGSDDGDGGSGETDCTSDRLDF